MPVGLKELAKWKKGQDAKEKSGGAMAEMIRAAHSSGSLNLSNRSGEIQPRKLAAPDIPPPLTSTLEHDRRNLKEIPEALLTYDEASLGENWWEVAGLKKLDLSHNSISTLPPELFIPLTELQVGFHLLAPV